jgi:ribosomal protein S18 acetylase RimI-like enzyme
VRALQERAARAQPADHVERIDGWWLRFASGGAWWVGTALPHGEAGQEGLARRVERAEAFYAARDVAAGFQVTPGVCPDRLDALLAARGYRRDSAMSLQVAAVAGVRRRAAGPDGGAAVAAVDDRPGPAWLDAWHAVHGPGGDPAAERERLAQVGLPCAYAAVRAGGRVVGVGRAVVEAGWTGVFGMATRPEARGRGAARAVLAALAAWASDQGARSLYLQVERDNAAARRLYQAAGFTEVSGYHYRRASRPTL